ncbi:hypothetical protein MJD09_19275 [bacterium]|nr:hypothetical protein [bacterium]
MARSKLILITICVMLLPAVLTAQLKEDTQTDFSKVLVKPNKMGSLVGLLGLDPNRFSMNHSYTFSVGSFGGESFSQGLYLNTMRYQLSNPITMYLQLGFQHQPLGSLGQSNPNQNQVFLSGAGFQYEPSDNFQLRLEFSQTPNRYYNNSGFSSYRGLNRVGSVFDSENQDNR